MHVCFRSYVPMRFSVLWLILHLWKRVECGTNFRHRRYKERCKIVASSSSASKFIYSDMATKLCEIFTSLLTGTTYEKSKIKISQNFVVFSEYTNFKYDHSTTRKTNTVFYCTVPNPSTILISGKKVSWKWYCQNVQTQWQSVQLFRQVLLAQ